VGNENANAYAPAARPGGEGEEPAIPDALLLNLEVTVTFALR
jgi:hypothetical protein